MSFILKGSLKVKIQGKTGDSHHRFTIFGVIICVVSEEMIFLLNVQ